MCVRHVCVSASYLLRFYPNVFMAACYGEQQRESKEGEIDERRQDRKGERSVYINSLWQYLCRPARVTFYITFLGVKIFAFIHCRDFMSNQSDQSDDWLLTPSLQPDCKTSTCLFIAGDVWTCRDWLKEQPEVNNVTNWLNAGTWKKNQTQGEKSRQKGSCSDQESNLSSLLRRHQCQPPVTLENLNHTSAV